MLIIKTIIATLAILLNLFGIIVLAKLIPRVKDCDAGGFKIMFFILSSGLLSGFINLLEVI